MCSAEDLSEELPRGAAVLLFVFTATGHLFLCVSALSEPHFPWDLETGTDFHLLPQIFCLHHQRELLFFCGIAACSLILYWLLIFCGLGERRGEIMQETADRTWNVLSWWDNVS